MSQMQSSLEQLTEVIENFEKVLSVKKLEISGSQQDLFGGLAGNDNTAEQAVSSVHFSEEDVAKLTQCLDNTIANIETLLSEGEGNG